MDHHIIDSFSPRLHQEWNAEFKGRSLTALKERLHIFEGDWKENPEKYYAKTYVIFQSSGTGKSRLAHEIGKVYLQFPFVFRQAGETGYPPGDSIVSSHLIDYPSSVHTDVRAAAFIAAVCYIGVQSQI